MPAGDTTAPRPRGLLEVTMLMCLLNPSGFLFAKGTIVMLVCSAVIAVSYAVLWFFWRGANWARWLVMITSALALLNVIELRTMPLHLAAIIVVEAALGAWLLFWLNTRTVRAFFRRSN